VHPTLIPEKRLLANVDGAMNAVVVQGDAVGPTLYYGPGAGAEPTASSVVADIMDVARSFDARVDQRVPYLGFGDDQLTDLPVLPITEITSAYYLRLRAADKPGVMAQVTQILADHSVSIDAMLQKEAALNETEADIVLLTQETVEKNIDVVIAKLQALSATENKVVKVRMDTLGK
jgi:homoserine dehydrogenase